MADRATQVWTQKMAQTGNLTMDPTVAIQNAAKQNGIPSWIALDIAQVESGMDPLAVTKDTNNALSVGLFQLNQKGQGAGYSVTKMQNATFNANVAIKAMVPAYKKAQAQGLSGLDMLDYVANNSGHPGYMGVSWTQANTNYDQKLAQVYKGTGGTSGGSSSRSQLDAAQAGDGQKGIVSGLGDSAFAFLQEVKDIETFEGFDITNPVGSILADGRAVGFRIFLFLLGLIVLIFGLVSIVGKENINAAASAAL